MANNKEKFMLQLELLTQGFDKGAAKVSSSINKLRSNAIALAKVFGAGLGISAFSDYAVTMLKELDKNQQALKNMSSSTREYADSLKYLNDLSKRTALDLNVLTNRYTNFSAALKGAGYSANQIKSIFQAVAVEGAKSGASITDMETAFDGLKSALQENEITLETLVGEFGDKLPTALAGMAKSVNMSMDDFKSALKSGTLDAKELINTWANFTNKSNAGFTVSGLDASINKLSTAVANMFNQPAIQNGIKSIVDTFTFAVNNITTLLAGAVAIGIGKGVKSANGHFKTLRQEFQAIRDKTLSMFDEIDKKEIDLRNVNKKISSLGVDDDKEFDKYNAQRVKISKEIEESQKRLNEFVDKSNYSKQLGYTLTLKERDAMAKLETRTASAKKSMAEFLNDSMFKKAERGVTKIALGFEHLKGVAKNALSSIKNMLSPYLWDMAIAGAVALGSYLYNLYVEAKRFNKEQKEFANIQGYDEKLELLKHWNKEYHESAKNAEKEQEALKEINKLIGEDILKNSKTRKEIEKSITDEIKRQQDALNEQARANAASNYLQTAQSKVLKFEKEDPNLREAYDNTRGFRDKVDENKSGFQPTAEKYNLTSSNADAYAYRKAREEAEHWTNVLANSSKEIESKKTDIPVDTEFNKKKKVLDNKLSNKVISKDDYDTELSSIATEFAESIGSKSNLNEAEKEFLNRLKSLIKNTKTKDSDFDEALADADFVANSILNGNSIFEQKPIDVGDLKAPVEEEEWDESGWDKRIEKVKELREQIQKQKEELKDLRWDVFDGIIGSINQTGNAIASLGDGFLALKELMKDPEATGWEKFTAVLNMTLQVMNSLVGVIQMVNMFTEMSKKAKQQEANASMTAGAAALMGGMMSAQGSQMAAQGANQETASNTTAAVTGAAKSQAGIPYIGPILAAVAAAGMIGMLIAQKKKAKQTAFANGGILSGPVNALMGEYPGAKSNPEVVAPLSKLNSHIDKGIKKSLSNGVGNKASGGVVEYRIQGKDLIGVMSNYGSKTKRYK